MSDVWTAMPTAVADLAGIADASGLSGPARVWADALFSEFGRHAEKNAELKRYYDGEVRVRDYGVTAQQESDQSCYWPQKAVDALAERVRLVGFEFADGADHMAAIERENDIVLAYNDHVPSRNLYGCMAATVTRNRAGRPVVRFHSAETFTAIPDSSMRDGMVAAGLAIGRMERTEWSPQAAVPTVVNLFLPGDVVELRQVGRARWVASSGPTREADPMLYVLPHKGVGTTAPFGRTCITRFVRDLTDDAIRCLWHMQVSGSYYSVPKLMLTNLTARQYDAMMEDKDKYQLDRLLLAEQNPDGSTMVPTQLSGNSPQPFVDELMCLAKQFSGATSVPLNSLGIVQDNPSSAEAITAAREDMCLVATQDIQRDRRILRRVALAAMAVEQNVAVDELDEGRAGVMPKFADPMPESKAARGDRAMKLASVREGFGSTDLCALMMGVDEADLPKVRSDEQRAATAAIAQSIFGGSDGSAA